MLNSREKEVLVQMNFTPGWQLVRGHIENRMASITSRLLNDNFASLDEIKFLQGEYKALKSIKNQFDIKEG